MNILGSIVTLRNNIFEYNMRVNKASTRINNLIGLAPLMLFLSSYVPLFVLIITRQILSNIEYLSWGGIKVESILCMIKHFGMSIICLGLTMLGLIGSWVVFENIKKSTLEWYCGTEYIGASTVFLFWRK